MPIATCPGAAGSVAPLTGAGQRRRTAGQHQLANGLQLPETPMAGELRLVITAAPPDKRRRDLSNHAKVLEDKLVGWKIMEEDSQVHDLRIHWDKADPPTITPGSVMVVLEVLADAA
jgi:Holliday junction resolvase RusA-like endonuclease